MISKGFMYARDPDETDHTKRIGLNGKMIFEILDDNYHIDLMAADKHTDTIVVVLKRKVKKEEEQNEG